MNALLGGILIGAAVSLMLLFNGRVTGISGIISGVLKPVKDDVGWRILFVLGLLAGGSLFQFFNPNALKQISTAGNIDYVFAGLLVGVGTLLGNGCTSGHGVCGISRFSMRSIFATLTFIVFGMISVLVFKMLRGSL